MLFSVDAHTLGCHLTGNEVYVRNLLNEFAKLELDAGFLAYVSRPEARLAVPGAIDIRTVSPNPFRRLGVDIPASLRRDRPDVLHVQYTAPVVSPVPIVTTVHDVSYLEQPEHFSRARVLQLKFTVERTVRRAARVLTPSEFSRKAIIRHYDVAADKVQVVNIAAGSTFRPIEREKAAAWIRERYGISAPFLVMVGDLQPRKNHLGLIRAFDDVVRHYPEIRHHLVLVGKHSRSAHAIRRAAERSAAARRIHFTGWVSDDELPYFYGASDGLIFPSHYEGFGLPILEAMACGRAVACSNTTSMPEVAGPAAMLFNPERTEEIVRAIAGLALNPYERQRLERQGVQRAAGFTWSAAARKTLDVYFEVAGMPREAHAAQPVELPVSPL